MPQKRLTSHALLGASTLTLALQAAFAQSPPEPPKADTITITGIRKSLESALNTKRNATQIVDAIVAEDIGKLPDRNVAESLARVSGVQVDRGIGEGTGISVRGLRQNVTLFNGREIVDSTGRGGVGLDQLGSSTYGLLGLVPSELIAALEVTKLAGADQLSGGLGGIVDIRSRLPLDGPASQTTQLAGKVGLTRDQLPGKTGKELFVLGSAKFAANTVGVLVSLSAENRDIGQQGLDTFSGYRSYLDGGITRFGNQDARVQDLQESRDKRGVNAVLQWRPNQALEFIADTFRSKLTGERNRYWLSFNPTGGLSNARYSPNNILLAGTATGAVLTNTELVDVESDVVSSALRARWDISAATQLRAEYAAGQASSSYAQRYFRLQPLAGVNPSVSFDFTKGDFGSYTVSGLNLNDPAALRFTILFDNTYRASTDNDALRVDLRHRFDAGWLSSVEAGVRRHELDSRQNPLRADIRPAGGIVASSLGSVIGSYSNPRFGPATGMPGSYLVATRALAGCATLPVTASDPQCLNPAGTVNALSSTFRIEETFDEGYGKLNLDGDIAGLAWSGNVGVRLVRRSLASTGNLITANGTATPTTVNRDDSETLPSAVLRIELSPQWVARAGAAKVVAFPNTADLNNGVTLSNNALFVGGVQTQPGTGSGGAPNLDPFRATQADLSLEHYFGKQALASVGLFNKDVSSFIVQQQSAETYGGINYLINRKVNGAGASVKGVELLLQLPFYFLPGPFDGFGLVSTYSYIDSKTPVRDAAGSALAFPGLSKNNVNLVGYYERGPLGVRLAYNWRDAYLVSLSAAATGIYNDAYKDFSATLRYEFSPKLSLNLEASNLLDSQQRTYDLASEGLRTNNIFGRIYKFSLNFKL
ncbi:MAG: TonB-dependent receptor [Chitinophagaceae bacterium]|nr:TonB-dependent receptor [Rubrivivax sp.]